MWHFRSLQKGEKIRDPIQGEFFATDAIADPAHALVRESIQNSLDAATADAIRVRLFVSASTGAAKWADIEPFVSDAWPHYMARRNGLRDVPEQCSPCEYLVVEDFNTSGLTGDTDQAHPLPDVKNPFLLFFRAEGRSDKGEQERGRWGVGKFVFPRSSRISTHFGFTVRSEDSRRLLLGAATLKSHLIDGQMYSPDGLFGILAAEEFVRPIEAPDQISKFRSVFSIRRDKEPGLSVVVPFADEGITYKRLLAACATDYFLPILQGKLVVEVETPGAHEVLSASSLHEVLARIDTDAGRATARYVDLAVWGASVADASRYSLEVAGKNGGVPRWSSELLSAETIEGIRREVREHHRICVRVPLMIRPKHVSEIQSFFDVLLVPDRASEGRPLFVREGIVVSDIKAPRVREVLSLVLIEDKPLATFLGDSENPAHTQWQKDGSNFRGRYKFGPGTLDFVTASVAELMKIVNSAEKEEDASLTVDFFSLRADDIQDPEKGTERQKEEHEQSTPKVEKFDKNPPQLIIVRNAGGFAISNGPGAPVGSYSLSIQAAYDVRTGNPLKRYHIADFDIGSSAFKVNASGAKVHIQKRNSLVAEIESGKFTIEVSGFDQARDLYVRANIVPLQAEEHHHGGS